MSIIGLKKSYGLVEEQQNIKLQLLRVKWI